MNYEEIKKIIESKYDRAAWQKLLHDIFQNKVSFLQEAVEISVNSSFAKRAIYLGKISLSDGESLAIYEVELADNVNIARNRTGIRNMLTTDWRNGGYTGAFMFCYPQNKSTLRFSYVSETWGFDSQGTYKKTTTDTRRYTYLLGEGAICRTAVEQFIALRDSKQTLSDITNAFSVEALTKQFYKDLFGWYQWAIDPASNISFPNNPKIEEDDREDIETKIIRMITRVMFIWFIKEKNLVPDRLFDIDFLQEILKDFDPYSTTMGDYYNAILQNLFFGTLNREIIDEEGNSRKFATEQNRDLKTLYRYAEMFKIGEQEILDIFAEVPFMNGGLFECQDKTVSIDGVENPYYYDGFSRSTKCFSDGRYKYRAVVPNNLFFDSEKGLIPILKRYHFTIEENTPQDQQVALDPELLGKVFENLLGVYNAEDQETARNLSGSFYTPREIVNYMVDESLIAYLGDNEFTRSLFGSNFCFEEEKIEEYKKIVDKLKQVKVLDPACGSGAFPMGILNRLVEIIERISPDENIYELKLALIEKCLYGSDIQSIAIQITKLRFFISLICDCERDSSKPNFGIPALPNLETKFVAANSLIEKKKRSAQRSLFENPDITRLNKDLEDILHKKFHPASASSKKKLRKDEEELREKLANLLEKEEFYNPEDTQQLVAWKSDDQNAVSPFFSPEWMFQIKGGFDIVIGNPPYIQLQNNTGKLAELYKGCGYSSFNRMGDIYCLFYERGWQLLKEGGHLCYITSNKWMRAGYGKEMRKFLAEKTNPLLLIDFAGVKIFESATVDPNILLYAKAKNQHQTRCAVTNKQNKEVLKNLSDFVQRQDSVCDFSSSESWVILSPIEQSIKRKIEAVGTPLKDWDININYGIKTGCNEAFIINTEKREEILANCQTEEERQRTAELIRPILRGQDIKRYAYEWAEKWIIATFPSKHYNIDEYPAVKQYLLSFGMERLEQTGKIHIVNGEEVKARKRTRNKWFETQDSIAYWEDFSKPKIVYSEIVSSPQFYLDDCGEFLPEATTFIMSGKHLQYLYNILNSNVFTYFFKKFYAGGGLGEDGYRYKKAFLERLPIPIPQYNTIQSKIKDATATSNIERECLSLFGFSAEEIAYIESQQIL